MFLLNFVAILWGTQHAIIKSTLDAFDSPSLLNFWRFFLSALLFSPSLLGLFKPSLSLPSSPTSSPSSPSASLSSSASSATTIPSTLWRGGLELGFYTFLGFAFQSIGLQTTTASRSAFLLYLNVKFVPIFATLFYGKVISKQVWTSALFAFTGTFLLSNDNGGPNIGDLWSILAAMASALFILRLETFSVGNNAAQLNGISTVVCALIFFLWVLCDYNIGTNTSDYAVAAISATGNIIDSIGGSGGSMSSSSIIEYITQPFLQNFWPIFYLGIVCTAICNYIQTIGQRNVSAERAAIVYSMDPVYGSFFSWLILHEQLGTQGFFGAGFILAGVWLSSKSTTLAVAVAESESEI